MIYSKLRSYKDTSKGYIQQKEKRTIFMGLFTFISGAQYEGFWWERNRVDKKKILRKTKGVQNKKMIGKSRESATMLKKGSH